MDFDLNEKLETAKKTVAALSQQVVVLRQQYEQANALLLKWQGAAEYLESFMAPAPAPVSENGAPPPGAEKGPAHVRANRREE